MKKIMLALFAILVVRPTMVDGVAAHGGRTEETAQQKEKINARNETIKRQKAVADANTHRPPDAVTQRLRDGDA